MRPRGIGLATKRAAALVAAWCLAACAVGPDFERPAIETPATWRDEPVADAASLADLAWWTVFDDPALTELVRIALEENQDYLIAIERIAEFRARLGFSEADLYPQLDLSASAGQVDLSRQSFPAIPPGTPDDDSVYYASVDLFWELDVFGRIRRANEAERALLLASEETRRAVAIALVAAVGQAYVELRDFDRRLEISRRTLESRAAFVDLARLRFEGGLTSEVDWRQAEAEYFRTQAIVQDFERLDRQQENRLALLLGRNPGPIVRAPDLPALAAPPDVPAGLPSALLERRPDLRSAENVLHAQTADIGAAKALLFPRISLTGSTGFESTDLDDLFDSSSQAWSLAGNLLQPIFQGGRLRENLAIQESQMRQSLYEYERSVRTAFGEVEDALIAYRKAGEQSVSQAARVAAEAEVLRLVDLRYRGGVSDYLAVLDAQRSLFGAELDEVAAISSTYVALIQLYKSLGGGWPTAQPQEPEAGAIDGAADGVVEPAPR